MKKYELTTNTKVFDGKTLYQIRALVSFGTVNAGDLGGYIEKEDNLSQADTAWVYGDAWVSGNADYLTISSIGIGNPQNIQSIMAKSFASGRSRSRRRRRNWRKIHGRCRMMDKVLCPWCGGLMTLNVNAYSDGTVTGAWAIFDYCKTWRCWLRRPTDEERQSVAWEESQ